MKFTPAARVLGITSAVSVVALEVAYAVTLAIGLRALESPQDPIADPMFWIMEVLIIGMMPALVVLMVAVHAWSPARLEALSLCAIVFMGLVAGVTSGLHFVILAVSRDPSFTGLAELPLLFSFTWPSVAYALDVLAWDVFFPLAILCAAPIFRGDRLAMWIRWSMIVSGVLAFAGLAGAVTGDMSLRNIGILGYVPMLALVAALLAVLFKRSTPPQS